MRLAFSPKILAFCPKFLRSRNPCALRDIFALFKIHPFQRKFLRFAQLFCVMLKILSLLPISCVCQKLCQRLLRFERNPCVAKIPCVRVRILVLWEFLVLLTKIPACVRSLAFLYVISQQIRRFHSSLMRPPMPHECWHNSRIYSD